jgi:DhnA family fructose-bisphosphate aldolase class Ia
VTPTVMKRRMGRVFRETGRTLIVAMDHAALFGNMPGLEHPGVTLRQVCEGGADAVLTTYGVSKRFSEEIGSMGLILRVDGGVSALAKERGPLQPVYDVLDALRVGADAVGCMGLPGSEFEGQTLWYLSDLVAQCAEWGVPVMAEMLPGGFENSAEMWTSENIGHACRIAAELGADFVKTAYSGDREGFRQALAQVYIPTVVLGGGKSKDPRELLEDISEALDAGASGAAVGRNIYQHPQPAAITAAICAIIHDGVSVDSALGYLE